MEENLGISKQILKPRMRTINKLYPDYDANSMIRTRVTLGILMLRASAQRNGPQTPSYFKPLQGNLAVKATFLAPKMSSWFKWSHFRLTVVTLPWVCESVESPLMPDTSWRPRGKQERTWSKNSDNTKELRGVADVTSFLARCKRQKISTTNCIDNTWQRRHSSRH